MKTITTLLLVALLALVKFNLNAQPSINQDELAIMDVFHQFFNSVKEKDTVALKKVISPQPPEYFWLTMNAEPPEMIITSLHGGKTRAIIRDIGRPNSNYGKCDYKFEDPNIQIFEGFAILTVKNFCLVNEEINNCGRYIIQFIKWTNLDNENGFVWKIKRIDRIVHKKEYCSGNLQE